MKKEESSDDAKKEDDKKEESKPKLSAAPLPGVDLQPKPQEAVLLEAEIKKLKKQLVGIK